MLVASPCFGFIDLGVDVSLWGSQSMGLIVISDEGVAWKVDGRGCFS